MKKIKTVKDAEVIKINKVKKYCLLRKRIKQYKNNNRSYITIKRNKITIIVHYIMKTWK